MDKAEPLTITDGIYKTNRIYDTIFGRRYPNAADKKYGSDDLQSYDLFYDDADDKPKPILINIHGGGFVGGDKKNRHHLCGMFADNGWFVINVNYRLCPAVQIYDQICDIYSVLAQIPLLKEHYNIDDKKVVLTGDSAGAFFAGYTEAVLTDPTLRRRLKLPQTDIKPAGLLLYSGSYDLPQILSNKIPFRSISKQTGELVTQMEEYKYFNDLSVLPYVNKKWCPTILSFSANDIWVRGHGELLQSALEKNNVPHYTHIATAILDNHDYHLKNSAAAKDVLAKSLVFLDTIKSKPNGELKTAMRDLLENTLPKHKFAAARDLY
jgi:acetyl esterase/lipase